MVTLGRWDEWIVLEEAKMTHVHCGHEMRVFTVSETNNGILTGINVQNGETITDQIQRVKIEQVDIDGIDYHMIFQSSTANYLMGGPCTLYAQWFLEMQGIMVLLFMINIELRFEETINKLHETFSTCSELFLMKFTKWEEHEIMSMFRTALKQVKFDFYESYLLKYISEINKKQTDLPIERDCGVDCRGNELPMGCYTEIIKYPFMHVDNGKLFVPFDINDPMGGEYATWMDVSDKSQAEIKELKEGMIAPFLKPAEPRPPLLTGELKYTTKKKPKMEVLVPKPFPK